MFIDTCLIVNIYGYKQSLVRTRVSFKIVEVREIYGRLRAKGLVKTKNVGKYYLFNFLSSF